MLQLGKLGALLRGERSQQVGGTGRQHGRMWAWMEEVLGHTYVHGVVPMYER